MPYWVLAIIPVFAIYIAGYKLYLTTSSRFSIRFSEPINPEFIWIPLEDGKSGGLTGLINGYMHNPESGQVLLDKVSIGSFAVNGITDSFILKRLDIALVNYELIKPTGLKVFNSVTNKNNIEKLEVPYLLGERSIVPFKLMIEIKLEGSREGDDLVKTINWINQLGFVMEYITIHGKKASINKLVVELPVKQKSGIKKEISPAVC